MFDSPLIVVLCVWLFCLGGAVGSFLNVVVYRLPAGLSLVHPGSRCPICLTPIKARDNLPVLGWLLLRGRCRQCKARIAARYPLVEFGVALLFVALAVAGPLAPEADESTLSLELRWGQYAYQVFLACSLVAAGLTSWDGHKLAWRLTLTALAIGFVAPLAWPEARISLPSIGESATTSAAALQSGVVGLGAAIGLLAAAALGARLAKARLHAFQPSAWMLAWLGVFLEWRAMTLLAVASLLCWVVSRFAGGLRRAGWAECLAAVGLVWLIAGEPIAQQWFNPASVGPGLFGAAALSVACLCWLGCKIDRHGLD